MLYQLENEAPYTRTIRARGNATNDDLIQDVTDAARSSARVLQWPRGLDRANAARTMHGFCNHCVDYLREDGDQLIRMPWRTLSDGQGDCKSTAILIAAMCAAAGRRVVLRFVQYAGDDYFGHVYAVVDGVPVDPQLTFSDEVVYLYRIDEPVTR